MITRDDFKKSELAIKGRMRRVIELLKESRSDLICCFYTGGYKDCTCLDRYPDRDPSCPIHGIDP